MSRPPATRRRAGMRQGVVGARLSGYVRNELAWIPARPQSSPWPHRAPMWDEGGVGSGCEGGGWWTEMAGWSDTTHMTIFTQTKQCLRVSNLPYPLRRQLDAPWLQCPQISHKCGFFLGQSRPFLSHPDLLLNNEQYGPGPVPEPDARAFFASGAAGSALRRFAAALR